MVGLSRFFRLFWCLFWFGFGNGFGLSQDEAPVVFKILFEWGGTSSIGSYSGSAEGYYAPSSVWTGHYGVNWKALRGKGLDESSPASLYRGLGSLAAMRPDDLLQFYRVGYSATATTGNGCTFVDTQTDPSDTYTAWIKRTAEGAILKFGSLEAGDVDGNCDQYDVSFTRDFDEGQQAVMETFFTFVLTNEDLANFKNIHKENSCSLEAYGPSDSGKVWGKATLLADIRPLELEAVVTPDSSVSAWVPEGNVQEPNEPGKKPLGFEISIQKKGDPNDPRKAFISVSFPYVSKNKGVCGNYPAGAAEEEGLRFKKEDFPEEEGLLYQDRTHLQSDVAIEKARFKVYAHDFGAWGTLRITAKDENGKEIKVKIEGLEKADLDLPVDDNANRIADAWERGKVNAGNGAWDDEEVAGQDSKGDGITLYNEYRGFVVVDGAGLKHRRLSPLVKEMFILDEDSSFPGALWKECAQIEAIVLNEELVDSSGNPDGGPLVNFNAKDKKAHPCFALRVQTIKGDRDPDPAVGQDGTSQPAGTVDTSFPLMAYAYSSGSIRTADYIKVFPDRARLMVNYYLEWLQMGLESPDSIPGQELRDPKNKFSVDEALQAWTNLSDPSGQNNLVQKMLRVFFIHEVGHICGGLPDHMGNPPEGHKEEARACFMWNLSLWDQRRLIVFSALGKGDPRFAYAY